MGANLKEVRERIKSVISTQQITKAMKMVSAAKLRRAQDAIVQMRPYAEKLDEVLQHILSNDMGDVADQYSEERPIQNVLIVVVTSDRGLCGAFNSNVIKQAKQIVATKYSAIDDGQIKYLFVGKRGFDHFRKILPPEQIIGDYVHLFSDLRFDAIVRLPEQIIADYMSEQFDAVEVCYSRFKNAAVQYAECEQYLPVPSKQLKKTKKEGIRADYIFEPDKEGLLASLIPSILQTQIHRYLLESNASDHGARMTAMDKATENADELLRDLRISYNKARQEAITSEISEIVGGAAALTG